MITAVLTNNKNLIENFLKSFSNKGNDFKNLIITVDNKTSDFNEMKSVIKKFSNKITILNLEKVETTVNKDLELVNYYNFVKVCPIQARLLLPYYFKKYLGINKVLFLDDDILVNTNIDRINFDQCDGAGVNNILTEEIKKNQYIQYQIELCNKISKKKYTKDILAFPRFVACAFLMTIYNDYEDYICQFFNSRIINEYIKAHSNNFTTKTTNKDILYPLEEHCFNVYVITHSKKFLMFNSNTVFHYWGNPKAYKDKSQVLRSPFIHAHLKDSKGYKNQWYDYYFGNDSKENPVIVYCVNDNTDYIKMLEESVNSVLRFNPTAEIHIIVNSNKPISISNRFKIHYCPLNIKFRERTNEGTFDRLRNTSYLKLYIPEILKDYKKCLFVDCDCLCTEDITQLYNIPVNYLAQPIIDSVSEERKQELGIQQYYSTNLMLMNLEALRQDRFREKCFQGIDSINCSFWCHEETLVNKNYYNKITPLPENTQVFSFNYSYKVFEYNDYEALKKNTKHLYFLHFPGPDKSRFWATIQYTKDYKYFKEIQRCKGLLSVKDFETKVKTIFIMPWNYNEYSRWFRKYNIITDINNINKADCAIVWGSPYFAPNSKQMLEKIIAANKPIISLEDSFIRAVYPFNKPNCNTRYKQTLSYTANNYFQFEAGKKTTLDQLLEECKPLNLEQLADVKRTKQFIIDNQLSKYNCQFNQFNPVDNNKSVLVVDQSYGDQSIIGSNATNKTFEDMLITAIMENPKATIYLKMHPESMNDGRGGFYTKEVIDRISKQCNKSIVILDKPINPISLLKKIDKVYVVSSGLGFEALMCGVDVVTFGTAFYAGWGLTNDRNFIKHHSRKLTFNELYYTVFYKFTKWVNPDNGNPITFIEALNILKSRISEILK